MNNGEIAMATLITIAVITGTAIVGSYAFTEAKATSLATDIKTVDNRLSNHEIEQAKLLGELKSDIKSLDLKINLLLKANGIKQ